MFKGHPKGLVPAALSNMGERFGYYIMNAVLALFLCSKFGLSEETSAIIYSVFYCGIYVLSLVGGIIADRTKNYNGTIMSGLGIMAMGYVLLAIPVLSTSENITWLLPFTCFSLFLIAFGNGLFKGNLQAIVGQMYDNLEKDAAKKGEKELEAAKRRRDSGFQIFYVFINIGGVIAPFVAPLLRSWWLKVHDLTYNADLPALCHQYVKEGAAMASDKFDNLNELVAKVTTVAPSDLGAFCVDYLNVFNTGVHYSFIASVVAMLISLAIFVSFRKLFPVPQKTKQQVVQYTAEEKKTMAKEIRQRMFGLYAVLAIVVFFWLSFHQNGQSLSFFARDFVVTDSIAPEIWQAVNPFFVIVLTPIIMMFFGFFSRRGKEISTPAKIAIGMGVAGLAFLFLTVYSAWMGYPSGTEFKEMADSAKAGIKAGPWVLIVIYFFLTVAELFISPLGLSFVSKVAPKNMQGLCQGLWLTTTAIGNLLLFIGVYVYKNFSIAYAWGLFAGICIISMIVMLAMLRWLERVTK